MNPPRLRDRFTTENRRDIREKFRGVQSITFNALCSIFSSALDLHHI
jgi:hypothetical protein